MKAEDIRRITVVGAGTMGHGIGQDFAYAGYDVTLHDISQESLQRAVENIARNLNEQVEWGVAAAEAVQPALDRIQTTTSLEEAGGEADLVIEAVFEDLELKRRVFANLDRICPERTILGSNTSSFMPSMLATATKRPDRVLVVHYFYPPPLMPLVEIVRGEDTADKVVKTTYAVVKAAGKSPIVVEKEAIGFIANRLQTALLREAMYIIEQGIATAQDVDIAVKESFGRRLAVVGPLELAEVQDGWDVIWEIDNWILPDLDHSPEPSPVIREKIECGELGPKTGTGKGFYDWTPESLEAFRKKLNSALAGFLRSDRKRTQG